MPCGGTVRWRGRVVPRSPVEQRNYRLERYGRYKDLCDELGVPWQTRRWDSHYAELRRTHGWRVRRSPDETFVRLTRAELVAWWRARFTDDELFRMGSAIDFTLLEEGGFGF